MGCPGLYFPSGSSTQGYSITMMLSAMESRGQTFQGNGIHSKQRYYCYSQHQKWTIPVSELPCVHALYSGFFSFALPQCLRTLWRFRPLFSKMCPSPKYPARSIVTCICQKLATKEVFTNSATMCRDTVGRDLCKEEKLTFLAGPHFKHYEKLMNMIATAFGHAKILREGGWMIKRQRLYLHSWTMHVNGNISELFIFDCHVNSFVKIMS